MSGRINLDNMSEDFKSYIQGLDSQLEHIALNTTDAVNTVLSGVDNTGTIDVTEKLQELINKNDFVYVADGEYLFTRLVISGSNKKILFGPNVKLKSSIDLADARKGHIDVRGSVASDEYPILQNVEEFTNNIFVAPSQSKLFKEGDVIEIEQIRPHIESSSVTTDEEHIQQNSYVILTVKEVDTDTGCIETYEGCPYSFNISHSPFIRKINPARNIEIIGQNTKFDKMGTIGHGNFINVEYGHMVKISGFDCFNGAGKAVEMYKTIHYHINGIRFSNPTSVTSAKGEAILSDHSGFGIINHCYIYNSRRGIDFATSWGCTVYKCFAFQGRFTTHGLLSKDIVFDSCVAYGRPKTETNYYAFTIGNNDYRFDENITIVNCKVYGGYYGLHSTAYSKNIHVLNCEFRNNVVGVVLRDAKDVNISTTTLINNDVDIFLENVIDSIFNGLTIINRDYTTTGTSSLHVAGDSQSLHFKNINCIKNRDNTLMLESTFDNAKITISNSNFEQLSGTYLYNSNIKGLHLDNIKTNTKLRLSGRENIVVSNSEFVDWVYGTGNEPIKNFFIINNIVTGRNGVNHPLTSDPSKNIYAQGNIYLINI